jgi:hypothetical protein
MSGVGRRLWTALALTYAALGLFSLLLYDDLAISAFGVLGAIAMLGLAFGVAWASGELAARRAGPRR